MNKENLPKAIAARIDAELWRGEQIVWSGQPIPGRFKRALSDSVVAFAILEIAFCFWWILTQGDTGETHWFSTSWILGMAAVLIGMALISTPYWMHRKARHTAYVITNHRALIFEGGYWRSAIVAIYALDPDQLRSFRRIQNLDGSGDLIFERTSENGGDDGRSQSIDHGFLAIRDVKAVATLIRLLALS